MTPYEQGREAYRTYLSWEDNPYVDTANEYDEWEDGFVHERAIDNGDIDE